MASSNNSIAKNNKKTKKPQTSTPTSKIKKEKSIQKSKEKKKNEENNNNKNNKNKKKLNFTNGNSKEKQVNGKKHHKNNNDDDENEEAAKTNVFPMSRIRTILKGEITDLRVSQEAVLAINNAAEKFLEQLAEEAYVYSVQDRKKYLSYNHLSRVVSKQSRYDFLSDFVPEKVKAEDALRETNLRGNRGG
ncbi:chromatin accessibility complex 16kD protein [Trifolium pratense]|uniref:chromatin accessibility complex 16kD protein n=1 Tax=Trifolium pratense TaxID=57577 RepID=UPI001E690F29|nr:chromatin accessibility complex 16kD protein [Trifolium pratense]